LEGFKVELKKTTKLSEVIDNYPNLTEYLFSVNPKYKLLKNPVIVELMSKKIDLGHVAQRGGWTFEELNSKIIEGIREGKLKSDVQHPIANMKELKDRMKMLLKMLYDGKDVENVKKEFKELISKADPILIAVVEGELTSEGYTVQDLMKACDIHLELFKDQISSSRKRVSKDHPLWRFIKDHDAMMFWIEEGLSIARELKKRKGYDDASDLINRLKEVMEHLKEAENHDVRQENTLFPVVEKYGIEEPPSIMWEEHYNMKNKRAQIEKFIHETSSRPYKEFTDLMEGNFVYLLETFSQHTKKEQEILYNVALDLLSDQDWQDIKKESDEIGYFELPKEVLEDE
jgi:DUF438 domain-containing protein